MLSIYQITRANGVCFMPGGFVLFRGYLQRASALQTLQALYWLSPSLAFQAVCLRLLVDGCYLLCLTLRKERRTRTRGKCLFYTVWSWRRVFGRVEDGGEGINLYVYCEKRVIC